MRIRYSALMSVLVIAAGLAAAQTAPPFLSQPVATNPNVNEAYTLVSVYFIATGLEHNVCFTQPNTNVDGTPEQDWIMVRRYRIEGGGYDPIRSYAFSTWTPSVYMPGPLNFCIKQTPFLKVGHWAYELAVCRTATYDAGVCSNWTTSLIPAGTSNGSGSVDNRPKGWCMYAFLPPPGSPGVN